MKLIIIFGPQAVGKMTVGYELEKVTGLKLFHNHMTIELVNPFFSYDTKTGKNLVELFRSEIFKAVAKSNMEGLIFTFIWAFNVKDDWDYIDKICSIFEYEGGETYFVELEADTDERVKRNISPLRLEQKSTKRNINKSEKDLIESMERIRMNSKEREIKKLNYIRINNTSLQPKEVANIIKERFKL